MTIAFKGGSLFLSRHVNDFGSFIKICEWKPHVRNPFVILSEGEGKYEWGSFLEVTHQMNNGLFLVNDSNLKVYQEEFQVFNPTKVLEPKWVEPNKIPKIWHNVIVCDVWGVRVPWRSMGKVLSF